MNQWLWRNTIWLARIKERKSNHIKRFKLPCNRAHCSSKLFLIFFSLKVWDSQLSSRTQLSFYQTEVIWSNQINECDFSNLLTFRNNINKKFLLKLIKDSCACSPSKFMSKSQKRKKINKQLVLATAAYYFSFYTLTQAVIRVITQRTYCQYNYLKIQYKSSLQEGGSKNKWMAFFSRIASLLLDYDSKGDRFMPAKKVDAWRLTDLKDSQT